MGFNTVHTNGKCYIEGFNKTNQTYFRYTVLDRERAYRSSISSVSLDASKMVIQINGNANINKDDSLSINGQTYLVTEIGYMRNELVLKKRADLDNTRGGMVVSIE